MIRLCFKHQYLEHENRDATAAKQIWDHVISLCENDPYTIKLAINGKKNLNYSCCFKGNKIEKENLAYILALAWAELNRKGRENLL